MKIKTIILTALIFTLVLLCGCNGAKEEKKDNSSVTKETTQSQTESSQLQTDVPIVSYVEKPQSQTLPQAPTVGEQSQLQETLVNPSGHYTVDYVIDIETQEAVEPSVVFGTAYKTSSKSLTLNEDKTFSIDVSVSKSNDEVTGTYSLSDNGLIINAKFNDGTQKQFELDYFNDQISNIAVPYGDYMVYFH